MIRFDDTITNELVHKGFQNINEIRRGSFGIVFSVNKGEESYAIKIIYIGKDEQKRQQCRRESNIMKNEILSRDYIVSYFAHWPKCLDNAEYLSIQMELCCPLNLNTIIEEQRVVIKTRDPPRLYQQVFPQILNGLSAIHSIGWVHRDIHPGNILIVRPFKRIHDIRVKIADFGNAKEIKSIMEATGKETVSAEPTFTLPYKAPEANNPDRCYDYKIDLFLAGCVLCLISGFNPKAPSKPFIHEDDDILADLIHKLTEHQPRERPSAEEALKFAWKERKFKVKRPSDDKSHPCVTRDNTIHSLKAVISSATCIPVDSQVLQRKKTTNGQEELIDITSDKHVKRMFEDGENVVIVVKRNELSRNNQFSSLNPIV